MKVPDIDPARRVEQMRQEHIYTDGALSAKTKTLMAVLWSIATRCEPCIRHYAYRASDLGVTEVELGEVRALATTMGACVAETWALKALAAAGERDEPPACSC
jgi:AhpD family alkylhydroperoxidase